MIEVMYYCRSYLKVYHWSFLFFLINLEWRRLDNTHNSTLEVFLVCLKNFYFLFDGSHRLASMIRCNVPPLIAEWSGERMVVTITSNKIDARC